MPLGFLWGALWRGILSTKHLSATIRSRAKQSVYVGLQASNQSKRQIDTDETHTNRSVPCSGEQLVSFWQILGVEQWLSLFESSSMVFQFLLGFLAMDCHGLAVAGPSFVYTLVALPVPTSSYHFVNCLGDVSTRRRTLLGVVFHCARLMPC